MYTQQWIVIPLASSQHKLYDIYYCCVYSTRLLMMDRVTVRNMYIPIAKNKFEILVHLVGFIMRVSHDAR